MSANLATLCFGAVFGFTLGWARIAEPETIYKMLRLMEPDLYLIMGSAIVTAAIGTRLLRRGGARARIGGEPIAWRTVAPGRHHVVGSVLFGLGWSVACTCPGPAAVQIGRGEISGVVIAAGIMTGVAIHDATRAAPAVGAKPVVGREAPVVGL